MSTINKTRQLPAGLEKVRRRFEGFRQTRKARTRIPGSLWAAAVKMAAIHGVNRTAKTLRLDYYSLKKRVEEKAAAVPRVPNEGAVATFLELAPSARIGSGECTLELEDAGGAKMRVHLKGFHAPDLAALSRSFWNPAP